jgi:hypothetical protein
MTDRYDDMRVSPDPSQAETLRQRLHERLASASRDDRKDRSHPHPDARLDPQPDLGPMKEIYVSVDSPTNEGRNRRRLAMAAAAAVAVIGVTGIAVAVGTSSGDDETQSPAAATTVAPATSVAPVTEELPAQAPAEFTACVNPGPEVQTGTRERTEVSLPDGEMTITRTRGYTWQSTVRDVSDPRLDGTWYNSTAEDLYTSPEGSDVPALGTWTHRIENDEGAWEGSLFAVNFTGDKTYAPLAMVGEGAYEGLTAVATIDFGGPCPNTRGYIIEGGVPAPPVPQTGQ